MQRREQELSRGRRTTADSWACTQRLPNRPLLYEISRREPAEAGSQFPGATSAQPLRACDQGSRPSERCCRWHCRPVQRYRVGHGDLDRLQRCRDPDWLVPVDAARVMGPQGRRRVPLQGHRSKTAGPCSPPVRLPRHLRCRPSAIHAGIASRSAAFRHSPATWRTGGSSSSPSDVPSRTPATSASKSARPAASCRSAATAAPGFGGMFVDVAVITRQVAADLRSPGRGAPGWTAGDRGRMIMPVIIPLPPAVLANPARIRSAAHGGAVRVHHSSEAAPRAPGGAPRSPPGTGPGARPASSSGAPELEDQAAHAGPGERPGGAGRQLARASSRPARAHGRRCSRT